MNTAATTARPIRHGDRIPVQASALDPVARVRIVERTTLAADAQAAMIRRIQRA